jgi:hypothetical protein
LFAFYACLLRYTTSYRISQSPHNTTPQVFLFINRQPPFSFTFFEVRIHVFNNLAPNITPHTRKIALRRLPRKQPYSTNLKQRHNRLRKLQAPISALQPAVIAPVQGPSSQDSTQNTEASGALQAAAQP